MTDITLSPCQESAWDTLKNSPQNIFLTGQAGTGKSFLVSRFLEDKDTKLFPIVASTGAAAVLVNGRTFHSFFGLGIMEGGAEATIERAVKDRRVVGRLKKIEGFILDEVSMIPGSALRAAESICRQARKNDLPWGGARVIAVGDFSQLPPVSQHNQEKDWAFLDYTWTDSAFQPLVLDTIVRTEDKDFIRMLNFVREGKVDSHVTRYLNEKTVSEAPSTSATHLFPHRNTADQFNRGRLAEIAKPLKEFFTEYSGDLRSIEALKKHAPIPEVLKIKESALVMIRVNDPKQTYVNGTLGHIAQIKDDELVIQLKNKRDITIEKMSFSLLNAEGSVTATAKNFPITLAYATTIHKAQGATLDAMVCDLRQLWEPGQAYVALSRLKSGNGLTLIGWDEKSIKADPQVREFHESMRSDSHS